MSKNIQNTEITNKNIFSHPTLRSYLDSIRQKYKLKEVATKAGVSYQAVGFIFSDKKEHWVLGHLSGFKKAFKLKKEEGAYFELLAILAAYPYEKKTAPLLKRAFHLAGRLEAVMNTDQEVASSLVYWIDPLCAVLRNAVELHGFPAEESGIPGWISDRVATIEALNSSATKSFAQRIVTSWSWLKKMQAVSFSEEKQRWVKTNPMVVSEGRFGPDLQDLRSAIFSIVFLNLFNDFSRDLNSSRILVTKFGNFTISSKNLNLVKELCTDFVVETVKKLNYACNKEDLKQLKKEDPAYYQAVLDYQKSLTARGFEIHTGTNEDVDTSVQLVLAARKLLA